MRGCPIAVPPLRMMAAAVGAALLAACTVGPDYHQPHADAPPEWRTDSYWHVAEPSHAPMDLTWWMSFNDAALNTLEGQALDQNQTLAAAVAHYEQAKATLANTAAQEIPEVDLGGQAERLKISKNRPVTTYSTPNQSTVQNGLIVGPQIDYDTDLFGRIRREVEGAKASAEQSADDLANARLVLTTDLASDYYSLRELDAEIDVLNRSVVLQQKALDYVTRNTIWARCPGSTCCSRSRSWIQPRCRRNCCSCNGRSSSMRLPRWSACRRRNSRSSPR